MSCGHETEINTFDVNEPDWIKNFLSHEFKYKPGTCFMYNTAGTNMLCAALKRRTGENLFEYLTPRLFEPLGMENIECFRLPDGIEMGGAGSRLKTEDMARFILFVSRHGKWEGKQLLNAESFRNMASANQVSTISPANNADNPDWRCGYGFQFWRCVPEHVFRADGAFGQYGVVFEDERHRAHFAEFLLQSAGAADLRVGGVACRLSRTRRRCRESPMAHVLKKRLEKAEITPMLSFRNPWSEKEIEGKKFAFTEGSSGACRFHRRCVDCGPQGGVTKTLRFESAPKKQISFSSRITANLRRRLAFRVTSRALRSAAGTRALWVAGAVTSALSSKFAVRNPQAADE